MAVSIEDIKKLRKMTGAGMMDCKNALAETEGDIQAAIEIIRKKGQAVAAKREDREAAEGCVLSGAKEGFAAIVALKCETDFVANNESFRALTKKILEEPCLLLPSLSTRLRTSRSTAVRSRILSLTRWVRQARRWSLAPMSM